MISFLVFLGGCLKEEDRGEGILTAAFTQVTEIKTNELLLKDLYEMQYDSQGGVTKGGYNLTYLPGKIVLTQEQGSGGLLCKAVITVNEQGLPFTIVKDYEACPETGRGAEHMEGRITYGDRLITIEQTMLSEAFSNCKTREMLFFDEEGNLIKDSIYMADDYGTLESAVNYQYDQKIVNKNSQIAFYILDPGFDHTLDCLAWAGFIHLPYLPTSCRMYIRGWDGNEREETVVFHYEFYPDHCVKTLTNERHLYRYRWDFGYSTHPLPINSIRK